MADLFETQPVHLATPPVISEKNGDIACTGDESQSAIDAAADNTTTGLVTSTDTTAVPST